MVHKSMVMHITKVEIKGIRFKSLVISRSTLNEDAGTSKYKNGACRFNVNNKHFRDTNCFILIIGNIKSIGNEGNGLTNDFCHIFADRNFTVKQIR